MNKPSLKKTSYYLSAALGVCVAGSAANAALLAYEGFDYAAAANTNGTNGGTGWASGSSWSTIAVNTGRIGSGGLASSTLQTTGNHIINNSGRSGRFLDTTTLGAFSSYLDIDDNIGLDNTTIYISFLQQSTVLQNNYSFELHRDNLNDAGRVTEIGNIFGGGSAGTIELRKSGTSPELGASDLNVNFYVMKIEFNGGTGADTGKDLISVYRNPSLAAEPMTATVSQAVFDDLSFDGISFGQFTSNSDVYHDEVRIGTTYASVTPVPEPSVALLGALGTIALLRRKK